MLRIASHFYEGKPSDNLMTGTRDHVRLPVNPGPSRPSWEASGNPYSTLHAFPIHFFTVIKTDRSPAS